MVRAYYPFLALLLAEGSGAADCYRLPKDYERAFELLRTAAGRKELSLATAKPIGEIDWGAFDAQVEAIDKHGVGVVTFRDVCYPAYFRHISKSPPMFFYKGDLKHLSRRGVAMVGSRNASAAGCRFASTLAGDLAANNVMVASGVARGIDAAAHRGALESGGSTVGVIGTGIDVAYPRENVRLLESIAHKGCLLTEQLMGTRPQGFVFPLRNRLISALSHFVVVVEAAARSGALLTARWALEQGRDVGAVPGFPHDPRSRGVNRLLKMGAVPIETVQDIFEAVPLVRANTDGVESPGGGGRGGTRPARGFETSLTGEALDVFEALGTIPADPDTLARHLDQPVVNVQRILLDLEVNGLVARDLVGGYYRI